MKKFVNSISSSFLFTLLLVSIFSFTSLNSSAQKWEKLGTRKVNFKLDRDAIHVTGFEGFFTALQIKVKDGAINMHKMEVYFHNGKTKEIELKNNFAAGSESRVIDLPGNKRIIDKVVFWYDTKGFSDSKAEVELWGRH